MTVYEMARKYYPQNWNDSRLDALVAAGKLTEEEAEEIRSSENGGEQHE